jgi:hypothetical protein
MDGLERVRLAEMLHQILLVEKDRCPVGDRRHPGHADIHRLRVGGGSGGNEAERAHAGQREFVKTHYFPPSVTGLLFTAPASFVVVIGRDCRGSN